MSAFDVIVLGAGTAGVQVATDMARENRSVALVEAGLIGGESPYLACLPSNSLLLSAGRGEAWEDAAARRDEVTGGLDDSGLAERLAAAGVTVIRGTGRVTGPGTVTVPGADSTRPGPGEQAGHDSDLTYAELTYADLVIATGCEPVAPPIEGLSDIPAWTTAEGLCSPDLPRRLIVLGGGSAGCELAQAFAAFGSQVTLIEAEPRLLPGEPAFVGESLAVALRRAGAEIRLGSPATKAERTSDGLTLALEDGTRIDADRVLLATGRRPRISSLGLDTLGLAAEPGSALPITATGQVAGIRGPGRVWAAGDVTGLTHTHASRYQAEVVSANILGRPREADYSAIPRCVFTTPSVYAVGERVNGPRPGLAVARIRLADTTRGRLGPDDLGGLELYAADGVLVGAVAVGPDAAAWMAEVTLAIRARIALSVLADVVHAFPTYGEALQAAFRELAMTEPGEKRIGPMSEMNLQTPEDDALEQNAEVVPAEPATVARPRVPLEVNEADAAEQDRVVGFGDDGYR